MKVRSLIGIAAAASLGASGVLVLATSASAGATTEFTLISRETNDTFLRVNPNAKEDDPGQTGDRIVIREDLYRGTKLVGFDNIICTVTFNDNLLCDGIFSITGKGDIHLTALLRGAAGQGTETFDATIDGGTFAYRNAGGSVHITSVNNETNDSLNTFTIS